jgi:hypothetical protein
MRMTVHFVESAGTVWLCCLCNSESLDQNFSLRSSFPTVPPSFISMLTTNRVKHTTSRVRLLRMHSEQVRKAVRIRSPRNASIAEKAGTVMHFLLIFLVMISSSLTPSSPLFSVSLCTHVHLPFPVSLSKVMLASENVLCQVYVTARQLWLQHTE